MSVLSSASLDLHGISNQQRTGLDPDKIRVAGMRVGGMGTDIGRHDFQAVRNPLCSLEPVLSISLRVLAGPSDVWVTAPTLLFVFPVPLWSRGRHDPLLPVDWSGYQEQEGQAQGTGCGTQHPWMLTLRSDTRFGSRIVSSPLPARISLNFRIRGSPLPDHFSYF